MEISQPQINDQVPDHVPPIPQTPRAKQRQCQTIVQAFIVTILLLVSYFFTAYCLCQYESMYWQYAYYLSPIFMISLCLVCGIYILVSDSPYSAEVSFIFSFIQFFSTDPEQQENCFYSLIILIPITLMTIPLLMSTYLGVFHQVVMIQQTPTEGIVANTYQITYGNEDYTVVLYNISVDGVSHTGYGCISSQYEGSLATVNPSPFRYYRIDEQKPAVFNSLYKLPSWFCLSPEELEPTHYYLSKIGNPQDQDKFSYEFSLNFYLITHRNPPYIANYMFIFIVAVLYQSIWFFGSIWIFLILVYRNSLQVHRIKVSSQYRDGRSLELFERESSTKTQLVSQMIKYPSRRRRIILMLLGFSDWCMQLYYLLTLPELLDDLRMASYLVMLLPALGFLFLSFLSKIHRSFLPPLFSDAYNQPTLLIRIVLILLCVLLLPFYFVVCYLASLCLLNMYLFTSRDFIALWNGIPQSELMQNQFNRFMNKMYLFQWVWRCPMTLILMYQIYRRHHIIYNQQIICFAIAAIQGVLGLIAICSMLYKCTLFNTDLPLIYGRSDKASSSPTKIETAQELSSINMKSQI